MDYIDQDYAVALQLQEEYDRANNQNNIAKNKSPVTAEKNNQLETHLKNLGSPTSELSDPTPNVHALFVQFDNTFFWGKLSRVVVRWSKRMYSCAGICRYEGRGGFCDIALSEPLLKLRPRKDLVETLLHEMIHAFLFLTSNDRDRDGHGPNFLQHMHRINKAANINISVYHTFHDEVRLYQTHWWRCDGPCQKQRPFFGMVRRSSNRAPGPSDFWWAGHRSRCGGTFIKVKEPEKKINLNKTTKKITNTPDIRKFIKDKWNTLVDKPCNKNNLFSKTEDKPLNLNLKSHSSSVSASPDSKHKKITTAIGHSNCNIKSKDENINPDLHSKSIRETVQNVWANKFTNTSKRPNESIESLDIKPTKIIKMENYKDTAEISTPHNAIPVHSGELSLFYSMSYDMVKDYNKILNDVYGQKITLGPSNFKSCKVDSERWKKSSETEKKSTAACPMCNKLFLHSQIDSHIEICINSVVFDNEVATEDSSAIIDLTILDTPKFKSPSTSSVIDLTDLDSGDDKKECLSTKNCVGLFLNENSQFDNQSYSIPPVESKPNIMLADYCNCPVCNKVISRNDAEEHLEDCVSSTFMGDDAFNKSGDAIKLDNDEASSVHSDDIDDRVEFNANGTKITCPCCFFLIEEHQMNAHLDTCLL